MSIQAYYNLFDDDGKASLLYRPVIVCIYCECQYNLFDTGSATCGPAMNVR